MYPTHSAILHVIPRDEGGADPHTMRQAVCDAVENWLAVQAAGPAVAVPDQRLGGGDPPLRRATFGTGDLVRGDIVEVNSITDAEWAWQGWVQRPFPPNETCAVPRSMRTDVQMHQLLMGDGPEPDVAGAVIVTIREQLGFEDGIRPQSPHAIMAPPCGLLGVLFDKFRIFQGNIEWTRSYSAVNALIQIDRLHESIADRRRTVPLVVCVGDETQGPPFDPGELGIALFGTARVVHVASPRLTAQLRKLIGEKHRIGWNVLRLYRPGYSSHDEAGVHRFFKRPEIETRGADAFPTWLSSYIRREETFSIAPDPLVRDRLRHAETRQSNEARGLVDSLLRDLTPHVGVVRLESLRDAVALMATAVATAQDHRAEAEALASSYAADLDAIKLERHRLRERIDGLEAQVRGAAQSFLPEESALPDPKTVREAVEQVQSTVRDGELVFHERVIRQVARYRSGYSPSEIRDCLMTIRDVARQCRIDHGDGRTPSDYFREQGLILKTDISSTAKQQFRGDYELDIDRNGSSQAVLMGPHLDLSPRHRVYWHHDKEASRFVIGHIGDHLRDASTS